MPLADFRPRRLAPVALLGCVILGGCAESLSRNDFLSEHTGDAIASNKAIHIADPWPRDAFNTRLPTDGGRVGLAIGRYRNGEPSGAPKNGPALFTPVVTSGATASPQ